MQLGRKSAVALFDMPPAITVAVVVGMAACAIAIALAERHSATATGGPPRRDAEYPPPELLESLRPVHAACVQRTGVSEATIVEYSDARHPDDAAHAATDIEQLKCYMACVFEQTQVVDRNGDVHLETLYNRLPDSMKDVALKMGLRCLKVSGSGPCERAFWLHSCWKRSDPMHYFII